jgi:Transposase DDE domain
MGFRGKVSRSTLADANETHDWRIFADFAQVFIHIARPIYANESLGFDLDDTVYALDSTTIDLCLSVFPWARFRATKAAIKLHTLLDIRGPIPAFIEVSEGKLHDVNILDAIVPEPGSFYVMDRAYVDFQRLHVFQEGGAFFVTRTKKGIQFRRRYSHDVDASTGLRSDRTVVVAGPPPGSTTRTRSAGFAFTMSSRIVFFGSSPTTSTCPPSPSACSSSHAGKWNCSSSGSSSTCGSRSFTDIARMP